MSLDVKVPSLFKEDSKIQPLALNKITKSSMADLKITTLFQLRGELHPIQEKRKTTRIMQIKIIVAEQLGLRI
jgi:hypothetical protein